MAGRADWDRYMDVSWVVNKIISEKVANFSSILW